MGQELVRRVRYRMSRERITQRQLAAHLGISQGHLSKVLRGQVQRSTRATRALEDWAPPGNRKAVARDASVESALVDAAKLASDGSERTMRMLVEVVRVVGKIARARRKR